MSEDLIERIRRNLRTEDVIRRAASDWKDSSSSHRAGRCTHPEHGHTSDDSNAGNLIVTDDGGWYCYSHDTGGDVFDWIAIEEGFATCQNPSVEGEAFVEVLKEAANRAGVEFEPDDRPADYEEAEGLDTLTDEEKARYALDEAVDILHNNLNKVLGDHTIRGYIKKHRPFDDDLIDRLRIGYLDGEAYGELMRRLSTEALIDIGLLDEDGNPRDEGRIIYPYNPQGLPTYWTGRATENSEWNMKYLKPKRSSSVLEEPTFEWGTAGSTVGDGVWITEGIQDAVALSEAGSVLAITSVSKNPSTSQKNQIISRAQDEGRAIICYDADEGGQGGAVDLALDLMSAGVQTQILNLPEGEDPCDYFLEGGEFEDLEPTHAAKRIIGVKGDSDPLLRRILDTAKPDTPRGERLVDAVSDCTPIRKSVLRDMMHEGPELEQQQGWMEPERVNKVGSVDDPTFEFVYPDGTVIEMDQIVGYKAEHTFCNKYGFEFNWFPDLGDRDLREYVNEWTADEDIQVVNVDPLSPEARTREFVQEQLQAARAVEGKEDLAAAGMNVVCYAEDSLMVNTRLVSEWLDELDVSVQKAGKYLEPIKKKDSQPRTINGRQSRYWFFDPETIEENGYSLPEPTGVPDTDEIDADEEVDSV